jgi:prophage regulatory protein
MKLITFARLKPEKGIDYSRDHLRRKCAKKEFPKPIEISDKRIAWVEAEVDAWLDAKRQARDDPSAETELAALPGPNDQGRSKPEVPEGQAAGELRAKPPRALPPRVPKSDPRAPGFARTDRDGPLVPFLPEGGKR